MWEGGFASKGWKEAMDADWEMKRAHLITTGFYAEEGVAYLRKEKTKWLDGWRDLQKSMEDTIRDILGPRPDPEQDPAACGAYDKAFVQTRADWMNMYARRVRYTRNYYGFETDCSNWTDVTFFLRFPGYKGQLFPVEVFPVDENYERWHRGHAVIIQDVF
jgi:hypothetical protein